MGPENPKPPKKDPSVFQHESSSEKEQYKWTSSVAESVATDFVTQTWGVQFCTRPSYYQVKGRASCWKQRIAERNMTRQEGWIENQAPMPRVAAASLPPDRNDAPIALGANPWRNLFATANSCFLRIYEAFPGRKPALMSTFRDADSAECFYCITWVFNADNTSKWWVCVAGDKGVIRVVDVQSNTLNKSLTGHGAAINDLKVHPRDPALIVSASKDQSLQLWNLRTGAVVAQFLGLKGHRGAVLSVDFDRCGHRMASSGIDFSIRIWDITDDDAVIDAIAESHKAADAGVTDKFIYRDETGARQRCKVPVIQTPVYVNKNVHKHYVDCAMWVRDLLLTKSVANRIYLWEPGADRQSLGCPAKNWEFTLLEEYRLDGCDVWFIRFALDRRRRTVACGGEKGVVYVFRLDQLPSKPMCVLSPEGKSLCAPESYVRQCAFSDDGSILLSVDDSSIVTQYDRVERQASSSSSPVPVE